MRDVYGMEWLLSLQSNPMCMVCNGYSCAGHFLTYYGLDATSTFLLTVPVLVHLWDEQTPGNNGNSRPKVAAAVRALTNDHTPANTAEASELKERTSDPNPLRCSARESVSATPRPVQPPQ